MGGHEERRHHSKSSHREKDRDRHSHIHADNREKRRHLDEYDREGHEATSKSYLKHELNLADRDENMENDSSTLIKPELKRDSWMLDSSSGFDFGGVDHRQQKRDAREAKHPKKLEFSEKELNSDLKKGKETDEGNVKKPKYTIGDAGSSWRMMKLRRVYETAKDENRALEEVALERYESLEAFMEAQKEQKELDKSGLPSRGNSSSRSSTRKQRFMFSDSPRNSVERFKRPNMDGNRTTSPGALEDPAIIKRIRTDNGKKMSIPSVFTPPPPAPLSKSCSSGASAPPMSQNELNRLHARAIKARVMGSSDADKLEQEYNREFEKSQANMSSDLGTAEVLPALDSRGQLYDLGTSGGKDGKEEYIRKSQGYRVSKKEKMNNDEIDDNISLNELVRQERFGGGSESIKNMDAEYAQHITRDAKFSTDLDYIDENVGKLSKRVSKSDYMKKKFAIQDYRKTKSILENCRFCYQEDNRIAPHAAMVSLATRTYLALPDVIELTEGHCQIVPVDHTISLLECENDVWEEIRNFMKCLTRMHAEENRGVIFMETVKQLKSQRHTCMEVIPIPMNLALDAPMYFKEALLQTENEWTQHNKVIDTRKKGFKQSMVSNLPYFHVWFNLDGGYGHVIENDSNQGSRNHWNKYTSIGGSGQQGDELQLGEDGHEFPYWFGKEVLGGMLDLGPERWRKPKRQDSKNDKERIEKFCKKWKKWDWTAMLEGGTLR